MKKWRKFKQFLHSGEWHCHTSFTDGKNTVFEMCKQAQENNLKFIAIAEHVRKQLKYDFNALFEEVQKAKKSFTNLQVALGCEAKVLDCNGNLDVTDEVLSKAELVFAAFHSFNPQRKENYKLRYLKAIYSMLSNPVIDVWAHPFLLAERKNFKFSEGELRKIAEACKDNKVLVEMNSKYNLPPENFRKILVELEVPTCFGSDAHSIKEIITLQSWSACRGESL